MFLKFLGNGSAFSKTHTSSYFIYDEDIYFLDISMYNVDKAMSLKPEKYRNIYIFITHMHDDHVGGIGLFIEKLYFLKGRRPIICIPRELFGDMFVYLKTIGVRKDMYKMNARNVGQYYTAYKVDHAPELKDNQIYVSNKFLNDSEDFFNQKSEDPFKVGAILIDAGHGGKDPGALKTYKVNGKNVTIQEKDINLKVAKMLYERLHAAYPQKQIILTRSTDVFLSLSERTDIANNVKVGENEAVLFISIHVNSSLNKTSSGYEVWYLSPGYRRNVLDKSSVEADSSLYTILNSMLEEEYTTESIMIAKFIMDGLTAQIGKESTARGIRAEEWFVVKNSNMPAVLIELGFVSNEKEALLLNDEKYLKKATLGIYNGIGAFITHFERSQGFTSVQWSKKWKIRDW